MDLELSATDKVSIRWNGNTSITEDNFGVARGQIAPADAELHNVKLGYTKSFGSSLLNEAAFGFNRVRIDPRGSTLQEILDFPLVNLGSGSAGVGPKIFDLLFASNSFTYMDTLSWVKGNHHYKVGAQVVRNQQNKALGLQSIVTFQNLDELADNSPSSVSVLDQPRRGIRNTFYAFFVQDDFKVSRSLTLNLGLRYQYDTAPTEANGVIANFDPTTGQVDPPGTSLWDAPKTNLAPRLGFAYSPFDSHRTAIRGGYGWYFSNMDGLSIAQNMPNNILGGSAQITRTEQPDLKGFPVPEIQNRQVASISAAPKDYKAAHTQSWNLNIQQALGGQTVQIGYVGHRGLHLGGPGQDLNRIIPGTDTRPLPDFGPITMVRDDLISDYHALQLSLRRPVREGFGFNVSYTWAHSTDNAPVIFGFFQDDTNPGLDHASSDFDIRHNLVFDYVYELPNAPGLPGWLGSNWQLNGITTIRSGFPVSILCGCDPLQVGQFTGRPDRVPDVPVQPSNVHVPDNQLNAEAFVTSEPGTLGNLGRNTERGPKSVNVDLSVFKNFRLRKEHNLQFRAEFFNLFNTPQFANPVSNITSADFGRTLGTISNLQGFGTNRQIQFALRYSF
ncbi:MAG: hypothetical protein GEU99_24650 [Luteitalea sp.]|nr:hypothetical protein [Luteitalea sp.]